MLSTLETRVLKMRANGLGYAEIAATLGIPQWHVKNLLATIRINLGARTTSHAVALAVRGGMI